MSKRILGLILFLPIVCAFALAQQTRQRPAAQRQPPPDLKITYRVTTAGQPLESTTMIKGARERNEMRTGYGIDIVSIMQCDLKRSIQLGERAKKYVITSMAVVDSTSPARQPVTDPRPTSADNRRGGVVTYTTSSIDTGERKEMFGFTARHVKTATKIESSPDACSPVNQRMETDGWYIDLSFGLDCELGRIQASSAAPSSAGCRDQVRFRREGTARTGYPLSETMRMFGPDGKEIFSTTKEVLELSREPLDAALFEIPPGYTEAQSTQELYMMSVPQAMDQISRPSQNSTDAASTTSDTGKSQGTVRVGVVTLNNKSGRAVPIDSLRDELVNEIKSSAIDAIPLNAISRAEAEVEAKAKECDFILYTDISALKSSSAKKLGGVFGRVTGVEGLGKTEARVDFELYAVGESSARLRSSATAKEEGDEASARTAITAEAKMVVTAVRK